MPSSKDTDLRLAARDCISWPQRLAYHRHDRFGFETFRKPAEAGTPAMRSWPSKRVPTWRGRNDRLARKGIMSDLALLQKKVRKLQSRAGAAKMELHDLAEDLPVNWTEIKAVAWKAFEVFSELDAAKQELAALENSQ